MIPVEALSTDVTHSLSRLLRDENSVSDLIAYLFALDPHSFLDGRFGDLTEPRLRREQNLMGGDGGTELFGRADLLLQDGSEPIALFEVKVTAGEHGEQLANYVSWAAGLQAKTGIFPKRFVFCLDSFITELPETFELISLVEVFDSFSKSANPAVSHLASHICWAFSHWISQRDGVLGSHSSHVYTGLAVKQAAHEIAQSEWARDTGWWHDRYFTVNGPSAALYSFVPIEGAPERVWTSVDVRAGSHQNPELPWSFRMGIQAAWGQWVPSEGTPSLEGLTARTVEEAQAIALRIAQAIRQSLTVSSFRDYLRGRGEDMLAGYLSSNTKYGNGLPGSGAAFGFYNDLQRRRLSNILKLDVLSITHKDLQQLVRFAHEYLKETLAKVDLQELLERK